MAEVGDGISVGNSAWTFSGDVSKNFDEHVTRSIPLYDVGHQLIVYLSDFYVKNDSVCYDIGCSTGRLLNLLEHHNRSKNASFVGVEAEPDFIPQALATCKDASHVSIVNANICDFNFDRCDYIVSYYTMQFIRSGRRQDLFDRIYNALNPGGAFVFFEKVLASSAYFQNIISQVYIEFRLDNGYSPDNILGKSRSLKGILEPFSSPQNIQCLARSGFEHVEVILRYACFEGYLAVKF